MFFRVVLLSFLSLCAAPLAAQPTTYTEDFSTRAFEDVTSFSADWDTVAQQLTLFPFASSEVGNVSVTGTPLSLYASDGYAYVGTASAGVQVVDVGVMSSPSVVSSISGITNVESIDLSGVVGALANGSSDVHFVFSSDPTTSTSTFTSNVGGQTRDAEIHGNTTFVAAGSGGMVVVDDVLGVVGSYAATADVNCIDVEGDVAWLGRSDGIEALDVSDRTSPVSDRFVSVVGGIEDVVARGTTLFAITPTGALVTVEDAYGVAAVTTQSFGSVAHDLEVFGDRAFIAAGPDGVLVVDVSNPSSPSLVRTIGVTDARAVAVDRQHLLVADASGSLRVFAWASVGGLRERGSVFQGGSYSDAVLVGDVLWAAAEFSGVIGFDVSDPTNPSVISGIPVSSFARGIAAQGRYLYVCDLNTGLLVIDVANPALPSVVATLPGIPAATAVAVDGSRAYVTGRFGPGSPRLYTVDISEPSSPSLLSTWQTSNFFVNFVDIAVEYGRVYLAAEQGGLLALEIVDGIVNSTVADVAGQGGSIDHLALERGLLYASESGSALRVFDTATMSEVGQVPFGSSLGAVAVDGRSVYLNTGFVTYVLDVSDPTAITFVRSGTLGSDLTNVLLLDGANVFSTTGVGLNVGSDLGDAFDASRASGVSTPVDGADERIVSVRGTWISTGSLSVRASTPAGSRLLTSGADFAFLGSPSTDLSWVADLGPYGDTAPTLEELTLEWRLERPAITSLVDVPEDQGGWIRLTVQPSGYDAADSPENILGYNVLRRVDVGAKSLLERGVPVAPDALRLTDGSEVFGTVEGVVRVGQRLFVTSDAARRAVPPGTWEIIGSFFASRKPDYLVLAPTTGDESTFYVSAFSSTGAVFASDTVTGSSIDNIAPGVPTGLTADFAGPGGTLDWDSAPESDFQYHRVYRSTDPDFLPSPSTLVHETAASSWVDPGGSPSWAYAVTTLDAAGNESDPARTAVATSVPALRSLELEPARPNPFNPRTTIAFVVPSAAGRVEVVVHDAAGRLVRTLLRGTPGEGRHELVWDGLDSAGRRVASGVYFARLRVDAEQRTVKMVLVE